LPANACSRSDDVRREETQANSGQLGHVPAIDENRGGTMAFNEVLDDKKSMANSVTRGVLRESKENALFADLGNGSSRV